MVILKKQKQMMMFDNINFKEVGVFEGREQFERSDGELGGNRYYLSVIRYIVLGEIQFVVERCVEVEFLEGICVLVRERKKREYLEKYLRI